MRTTSTHTRRRQAARTAARPRLFDAYRSFPAEYRASSEPQLVTVSPASYLAIDGVGEPGGTAFQEATAALYGVAYGITMARRKIGRPTFRVPKLEALWHGESANEFLTLPREAWRWTLLLRIPDFVADDEVRDSAARATRRSAVAEQVRRAELDEGSCAQVLHIGPYDAEPETLTRVNAMIERLGLERHGSHHEIYLSDPRRTAPERIRTILRHPVRYATVGPPV